MLLEFRLRNFKTFVEEVCFSLEPAPKQKDLSYSLLKQKVGKKNYTALCSSVIYGPNAAGKSNLIQALDCMKAIILRGHIRNSLQISPENPAKSRLEYIPNKDNGEKNVYFYLKWIDQQVLFSYELELNLGSFLAEEAKRSIVKEEFRINTKVLFTRGQTIRLESIQGVSNFVSKDFSKNTSLLEKLANETLDAKELFLSNGFKNLVSPKLYQAIRHFFEKKLLFICHSEAIVSFPDIKQMQGSARAVQYPLFNEANKIFGVTDNTIIFLEDKENQIFIPHSKLSLDNETDAFVPANDFESLGTMRFLNLLPLLTNALKKGICLVIDEFDASIHPVALMSIINLFHNDEINKNNAQLVFNTHNPIFLNASLFRRDEIKLVDRSEKGSEIYALSDFGTTGKNAVRNTDDYMKNYFVDRYGAIRDVDFTPVFTKFMENVNENTEKTE